MNNREPYQPPHEEPTKQKEVGFVMARMPHQAFFLTEAGQPREDIFKTWQEEREGKTIIHHQLTADKGREAAKNAFADFQSRFGQYSAEARSKLINDLDFGFDEKQNEVIRRSYRAHLIIATLRELAPERKGRWTTAIHEVREKIGQGKEKRSSAFEALDACLAEKTQQEQAGLEKEIGIEKAGNILTRWKRFISFKWVKGLESPARRQVLKELGATGALAALALILKGERGFPVTRLATALAEQPAESTPVPTLTPAPESTPAPKEISRREFLKKIPKIMAPPVETHQPPKMVPAEPIASVEAEKKKAEGEIAKKPSGQVVQPEKEIVEEKAAIESEAETLPFARLRLTEGDFIAINWSGLREPVRVPLVSAKEYDTNHFSAYFGESAELRLADKGANAVFRFHSLTENGKVLAGEALLRAVNDGQLKPGDLLEVSNKNTGEKINLAFLGTSRELEKPIPNGEYPPGDWYNEAPIQEFQKAVKRLAGNPSFKPLIEAINKGRNRISIATCDSLNEENIIWKQTLLRKFASGFTHKHVLAFIAWDPEKPTTQEPTPPGPKLAEGKKETLPSSEQVLAEKGETISLQGLEQEIKIPLTDVDNFFAAETLTDFQQGALVGNQISTQPKGETSNLLLHSDYYNDQPLNGQVVNEAQLNPGDKVRLGNLTRAENSQAGAGPIELTYVWRSEPFAREKYDQKTWPTSVTREILAQTVIKLPQDHLLAQALNEGRNFVGCLTCDPESKKTVDGKTVYPNIILTAFVV